MPGVRDIAVLAALGAALASEPALAADAFVSVGNDRTLSPNGGTVAINAGDTVTWNWVGPDSDHIMEADDLSWMSHAPGTDKDSIPVGHAFARQFPSTGAFAYHCRIHPDRMRGTVNVVSLQPPSATFTVAPSPSTGIAGQAYRGTTVGFDAAGSNDPDGGAVTFAWDLDGDGATEPASGTASTAVRSYAALGPVTVTLQVTDDEAVMRDAQRTVTIVNRPPAAALSATPSPAPAGQIVSFSAAASTDLDGTIAGYAWDLDGDGAFEPEAGTGPATARSYAAAGTVTPRVRVTDSDGATSVASLAVTIAAPPAPPAGPLPVPPAAPDAALAPAAPSAVLAPAAPGAGLTAAATQRLGRHGRLLVTGRCDAACTLSAAGSLSIPGGGKAGAGRTFRLGPVRGALSAAGRRDLVLKLPKPALAAARRALAKGRRVTAAIALTATGPGGSSAPVSRVVRLAR